MELNGTKKHKWVSNYKTAVKFCSTTLLGRREKEKYFLIKLVPLKEKPLQISFGDQYRGLFHDLELGPYCHLNSSLSPRKFSYKNLTTHPRVTYHINKAL